MSKSLSPKMRVISLCFILCCFMALGCPNSIFARDSSYATTVTPPTIIGSDTTWGADKTFVIMENTVVLEGAKLTIQPGARIEFGPNGRLEVRGKIDAGAASGAKVDFTSIQNRPHGEIHIPYLTIPGAASEARNVIIADVDKDGLNDLIGWEQERWYPGFWAPQAQHLHYIRAKSTGEWDPSITLTVNDDENIFTGSVGIGDVNNDGRNEIAGFNRSFTQDIPGSVWIYRWNGSGFDSPTFAGSPAVRIWLSVGDANNDGYQDILDIQKVANSADYAVTMLAGTKAGLGITPTIIDQGDLKGPMVIGDANNDGKNDVLVVDGGKLNVYFWNGSGFDSARYIPVTTMVSVNIADVDNDGKNEVIAGTTENTVISQWDGSKFATELIMTDVNRYVRVGDANNDSYNDLMSSYPYILWGRPNGLGPKEYLDALYLPSGGDVTDPFALGDVDNDGYADILVAGFRYYPFDPSIAQQPAYGGIWLRSSVNSAHFVNCNMLYAPVQDDSAVATFADCLFDRTGGDAAYVTQTNPNALTRCTFTGNGGGNGVKAASAVDCTAQGNRDSGILVTGNASGCEASGNGLWGISARNISNSTATLNASGMVGTNASGCFSGNNRAWGFMVEVSVTNSKSVNNREGGIWAREKVEDSIANNTSGTGITSYGTVLRSRANNNRGPGIAARDITDSVATHNDEGMSLSGTALRCTAAQNVGTGIAWGAIESCAIHHNAGVGALYPSTVRNSWIVGNGQAGILGRQGTPYTTINRCEIVSNTGVGVENSGAMNACNLFGNGKYDYNETRLSSRIIEVDVKGNYWGAQTTPLMNANPWGSNYNIPRIHDFFDDTNLCAANYSGNLASPIAEVAGADAPAFLLDVTPNLDTSAHVGDNIFTLTFSKAMKTDVDPTVTYDWSAPFDARRALPSPGWVNATTWRGKGKVPHPPMTIAIASGNFIYMPPIMTLRITGARAADGFLLPDDTAHQFLVSTQAAAREWMAYE